MGSVEQLKQQTGLATRTPQTFDKLIQSMKPQIQMALPRHLNADRMIRIALTCWRMNPKLADCDIQSVIASIMIASQLGLEPGVMGQCYLIPYKRQGRAFCQLVPGWKGVLDIVMRAGKAMAWTGAVYRGDEFDWQLGDSPKVTHKPTGDDNPANMTHVYAIAKIKGMELFPPLIEVWPVERVWKQRDKNNKVGDQHYSFSWPEMYARKVALLQVIKYLPQSIELATAVSLDDTAETGGRQLTMNDAKGIIIDGQPIDSNEQEYQKDNKAPKAQLVGPNGEEMPDFDEAEPQPDQEPVKAQKQTLAVVCNECRMGDGKHTDTCRFNPANKQQQPTGEELFGKTDKTLALPKASTKKDQAANQWNALNRAIHGTASSAGIPTEEIHEYARRTFKVKSFTELTIDQMKEVWEWIQEKAKNW